MYTDHHESRRHGDRQGVRRQHRQRCRHPDFPAQPDAVGEGRTHGRHPRGAGRGRAHRGDVRTALLLLLAEQPMHGYQIMQAITERTSGVWRPSPGAVYPTLSQLEDEGLIDTVAQEGGRKLATLTDAGQAYLHTHGDTMPDPFAEFTARSGGGDLRGALEELRHPARQLAMGNPQQVQAAQRVLAEARRSLYLILAGAPTSESDASDQ